MSGGGASASPSIPGTFFVVVVLHPSHTGQSLGQKKCCRPSSLRIISGTALIKAFGGGDKGVWKGTGQKEAGYREDNECIAKRLWYVPLLWGRLWGDGWRLDQSIAVCTVGACQVLVSRKMIDCNFIREM